MNGSQDWYKALKKPGWAPQPDLFGKVWSVLYLFIIAVNIYVLMGVIQHKFSYKVGLPFWINLLLNVLFTPIQFGLRNNKLACADIVLILATIIWSMAVIWPHNKLAALAFLPYLIWVCIATLLQFQITRLNG